MNRSRNTVVKHKSPAGPVDAGAMEHGAAGQLAAEDDFEAIEQAVLATARGRWFLGEYLRRHQNEETRRLVRALRRLARAGTAGEAMQHRAALQSLRLLLARSADELARLAGQPAEPTLPEAAAGRLALLLEHCAGGGDAQQVMAMLPVLRDTFRQMARLLGEAQARVSPADSVAEADMEAAAEGRPAAADTDTAPARTCDEPARSKQPRNEQDAPSREQSVKKNAPPAPREPSVHDPATSNKGTEATTSARRVSIAAPKESRRQSSPPPRQDDAQPQAPSSTERQAAANTPASSAARSDAAAEQSGCRAQGGGRIVIRRKEDSRKLDIPLPETAKQDGADNQHGAGAARQTGMVRIRARKQG